MGPLQRALTELENSQSPLPAQITEACRILGIDVNVVSSEEACQEEVRSTTQLSPCLGRDEWVLRWLLKTLRGDGEAGRLWVDLN